MEEYKKSEEAREDEEETPEENQEMYEYGRPWMRHSTHHGWGGRGWDWMRCECPTCRSMQAMHHMGMMGGMMPGFGTWGMIRDMGMWRKMGIPHWRRFLSSEERIAWLEQYLKDLQMEEKAVQEKIDHLRTKYQK